MTANRDGLGRGDVEPVELKIEKRRRVNRGVGGRGNGGLGVRGRGRDGLGGGGEDEVGQRGDSAVVGGRPGEDSHLTQQDYLQLMKSLSVRLPEGVLTPQVIELANMESRIQDAQAIISDLEHFNIRFKAVPRLGCREVQNFLAMKRDGQVLQITKFLFFDQEDDKEQRRKHWRENKTNTGRGFRLRNRYMGDTAVSTPAMYTSATRSWARLEVGEVSSIVTKGTRVNVKDIESKEYCDESVFWRNGVSPGPRRFGMFFQNKADELEMLKFFHELGEGGSGGTRSASYTKGNKVEYGFLSGRLDFLA